MWKNSDECKNELNRKFKCLLTFCLNSCMTFLFARFCCQNMMNVPDDWRYNYS